MIKKRDPKEFIEGADQHFAAPSTVIVPQVQVDISKKQHGKKYTFYLEPEVSDTIDKLILTHRKKRISRSDIIRVGIHYLEKLNQDDFEKATEYMDNK